MLTSQGKVKVALVQLWVALWVGSFSLNAAAFEEEWHAGGGLGAVSTSVDAIKWGPALNGYLSYGLSDMFDLKLDITASNHRVELAPGFEAWHALYTATAGATYKVDVLEWIPYFGAHVGTLRTSIPGTLGLGTSGLMGGGVVGIDYFAGPRLGFGFVNRWHWVLDGGTLVDLFLRVEYRWHS